MSNGFKSGSVEVILPESQNNNYTVLANIDNKELPNFNGLNADIADTYSTNKDDEKFEYQKRCFTGSDNIRNNSYDN